MKNILIILFLILLSISCSVNNENVTSENDSLQKEKTDTIANDYERTDFESTTYLKEGDIFPKFELPTINFTFFSTEKVKGKIIVINFFSLSCPICMKELPFYESEIWGKYKSNDKIEIIAIGREQTIGELTDFKIKKGYTFPIAADIDRSVYSKFAEKMIPRNIVVDRNGKIIYHKIGFNEQEFNNLKSIIETEVLKN